MTCPVCGEEMTPIMLDVGYAQWFCLDCENRRALAALEGCE